MINLSQETEDLAQRLAAAQSMSVEDTIRQALESRATGGILQPPLLPRDLSPQAIAQRRTRTDQFIAELAAMPILDARSHARLWMISTPYDRRQ